MIYTYLKKINIQILIWWLSTFTLQNEFPNMDANNI